MRPTGRDYLIRMPIVFYGYLITDTHNS
jgi:hypothetical protein